MSGKQEQQTNFKSSEEFKQWLSLAVTKLDRSSSEVIRACILLALPIICANPSLIDHVRYEDYSKDGKPCQ